MQVPGRELDEPDRDHGEDRNDEGVRRQREQQARFAHAAEVREHDHARQASERPTLCELSDGTNEVTAKIPAEIETATVRT